MQLPNYLRKSRSLLPLGLLGLTVSQAGAVGYRFPHQDPEAIARGNAFVATADNPSAVYYNPAGLVQLDGHSLSAGVYFAVTDIEFSPTGGGPGAQTDRTPQAVPQIFYAYSPQDSPWSFGFGVYAPYGLGIDYGNKTSFPTVAEEAKLLYASFNPVVAYEISDTLSVGAGLTLNYSDINFERSMGLAPGDEFDFEGDGYATGFNLGILWQPHEQWSFGVSYRSHTEVTYDGKSKGTPIAGWQNTNASLDFPSFVDVGVSYRPNKDWNIEFNVDWTDWDSVNTATFVGTFAGNVAFPFQYESGLMYEFGVTRNLPNGYYISAGYIYGENSVPDATLSPLNPDLDFHLGNVGVGRRGDVWSWALAYQVAYGERTVSGNVPNPITGQSANGKFDILNHGVNFSLRRKF